MSLDYDRQSLINELVSQKILQTKRIISAFRKVRRENFVLPVHKKHAYANCPLPIYEGQTISQPLTVAVLTEAAAPRRGDNALEIGAGSGYQAALLSVIVGKKGHVAAIEHNHILAEFAGKNLAEYKNVNVVEADGSLGHAKHAPYDCIIVSASAPDVPEPLIEQLKEGGRLVITVVDQLFLITKKKNDAEKRFLGYYAFVPLRGKYGYK